MLPGGSPPQHPCRGDSKSARRGPTSALSIGSGPPHLAHWRCRRRPPLHKAPFDRAGPVGSRGSGGTGAGRCGERRGGRCGDALPPPRGGRAAPWPVPRMLVLCLLSLAWLSEGSQRSEPMFTAVTHRLLPPDYESNPTQLNYGVAVTDLDADGDFEIVVAGYNGPNLVLKYDKGRGRLVNVAEDERGSPYYALRDRQGNAIGVTACDIDGDGREEVYFLNTNNAFSGMATYTDKLFKFRNGRWEDLLSDEVNQEVASRFAGRSVACVDRTGSGRYSIYIANYASGNVGPHALIEMDVAASDPARGIVVLVDVAAQAGVSKYTGGRGVAVGPILSDSASDIFCGNENSPNFLFHNRGDGTYRDVAAAVGLDDPYQHGRGVALADFNRDGRVDIVYGNWNGPHRLYLQSGPPGRVRFRDIATPKFSMPSPVRTVIAADFDNDQELEVFFNNIAYRGSSANRLFRLTRREHSDPLVEELNPGDALEPEGRGTGGAVTDFDGDGMLDLILSHGESMAQPISIFKGTQGTGNNWLRVIPRTRFGAFARGAKVVVFTRRSGAHLRIIDGGSGYLCEMEPVAHFGLGRDEASSLEVTWPDGRVMVRAVASSETNSVLEVSYPLDVEESLMPAPLECGQGFSQHKNGRCVDTDECTEFPFICPRDKPTCVNTYGGYRCRSNKRCSRGFEPNEDGTACVDIDECAQGLHNCSQLCTNTPGAHACHCHPGFYPLDPAASQCLDVDECQAQPGPCDHICHNSHGSFHCHHGFSLGAGGRCLHN